MARNRDTGSQDDHLRRDVTSHLLAPGRLMSGYRWLWVAWIVSFLVLEFVALGRGRPRDTLSDFVWRLCKVSPGSTISHWTFYHLAISVLIGWLWFHFSFGWFR